MADLIRAINLCESIWTLYISTYFIEKTRIIKLKLYDIWWSFDQIFNEYN